MKESELICYECGAPLRSGDEEYITGTGWVLKTKSTGMYYASGTMLGFVLGWMKEDIYTKNIFEAYLWPTRALARDYKMDHEKVVKVRVTVEEV